MADEIVIAPYDPRWPVLFELEEEWLRKVLPAEAILAIEHFGSTSISGMDAKPVIDIMLATPSLAGFAKYTKLIEGLDYALWADNPQTDRLFFVKGLPPAPQRTHHLHITEPGGELWSRLAFRDYLRFRSADAARYAALKHELAMRHWSDREAYTAAKEAFVREIMAKASAEGFAAPALR